MIFHFRTWPGPVVFLCMIVLLWSCKETKSEPTATTPEVTVSKPIPKEIIEILEFAELPATQSEELAGLIGLQEIDNSGVLHMVSLEEAAKTLKQLKTSKKVDRHPIIELKGTDQVVLMLQGRGYSGPIWAYMLLNKKSMVIEKLQFEHKAESEGYGDFITYNSFENQFTEKPLLPETGGFQLSVEGRTLQPGFYAVDGTSGATQTCKAAVDMINNGISIYNKYLFE